MNRQQILAGVLLAMGCWMSSSDAQVPYQFNYQGKLLNGTNLVNASTTMVFRLYNLSAGGSALYVETQTVTVVDGLYSTRVGESPNFGSLAAASTNQPLYLELQVGAMTLTPREQVVAVMYAIKADGVTTGAITTAMLANSAVTGAKIANTTITGVKIASGAVSNSHLAVGSVQSNKIDWTQMPAGLQDGDDTVAYQGYAENGTFTATPQASGTDAIAQGAGANAAGNYSAVGGGQYNTNLSSHAVISGGNLNVIESGSQESVIGGGKANTVKTGIWRGTIGGGVANTVAAGATAATISGGSQNTIEASAGYAAIGGGETNVVQSFSTYATIAGGSRNTVSGNYATVSGGLANQATALGATVGGGASNRAMAVGATVGGGGVALTPAFYRPNEARADGSTIAGGLDNIIETNALGAAMVGGAQHRIKTGANNAFIGGGRENQILEQAERAAISGGEENIISNRSSYAAIGGGQQNTIGENATNATISGGQLNSIGSSAIGASIGGGGENSIGFGAVQATIGGGTMNTMGQYAYWSTVGGGYSNMIGNSAYYATIPGGRQNRIGTSADYAFAAGRRAQANHDGAFVWADHTDADFASTANDQFLIRASGGVGIGTTNPGPGTLTLNGDLVITNSDGAYRGNIGPNKGAPFPRPAYDSGWINLGGYGACSTLVHGIGGDLGNYFIDMQMNDPKYGYGIANYFSGRDRYDAGGTVDVGNWYSNLTTNSVEIMCGPHFGWTNVRVRIWVYN